MLREINALAEADKKYLHNGGTNDEPTFAGTVYGNASTANRLAEPVEINGVAFDGIQSIEIDTGVVDLDGYATETWVEEQGYTSQEYVDSALQNKAEKGLPQQMELEFKDGVVGTGKYSIDDTGLVVGWYMATPVDGGVFEQNNGVGLYLATLPVGFRVTSHRPIPMAGIRTQGRVTFQPQGMYAYTNKNGEIVVHLRVDEVNEIRGSFMYYAV